MRWSQSLAVLDAIISPEWEFRSFSFDRHWGDGQQMASMSTGSGDGWSIVFTPAGTYLRGFDHESPLSPFQLTPPRPWPGLVDNVPQELHEQVGEPAFSGDGVPLITVCCWRLTGEDHWSHGSADYPSEWDAEFADIDGADWLFEQLDGRPETYVRYAENYFEQPVDYDAVRTVYGHEPLTDSIVRALNPELSLDSLTQDLVQAGYPRPTARGGTD